MEGNDVPGISSVRQQVQQYVVGLAMNPSRFTSDPTVRFNQHRKRQKSTIGLRPIQSRLVLAVLPPRLPGRLPLRARVAVH